MKDIDIKFVDAVTKVVNSILRNKGLTNGQWHTGTVKSVLSSYLLEVYVDGSSELQKIPCNPNIKFLENEIELWFLKIIENFYKLLDHIKVI